MQMRVPSKAASVVGRVRGHGAGVAEVPSFPSATP